jgi:hypothetical protein
MNRDVLAYVTCALWSTNDESDESGGEPMDKNYSAADLAPSARARLTADVREFLAACTAAGYDQAARSEACESYGPDCDSADERAAHDLWLNRNGHGAGFGDGDWAEPFATWARDYAHAAGERDLYVGDDGRIYVAGFEDWSEDGTPAGYTGPRYVAIEVPVRDGAPMDGGRRADSGRRVWCVFDTAAHDGTGEIADYPGEDLPGNEGRALAESRAAAMNAGEE